jgi:hypothetical protein
MAGEIWRCDDCGRWVNSGDIHDECDSHDVQCWVDFEIRMFLATSQGKFEIFYARRRLPDVSAATLSADGGRTANQ